MTEKQTFCTVISVPRAPGRPRSLLLHRADNVSLGAHRILTVRPEPRSDLQGSGVFNCPAIERRGRFCGQCRCDDKGDKRQGRYRSIAIASKAVMTPRTTMLRGRPYDKTFKKEQYSPDPSELERPIAPLGTLWDSGIDWALIRVDEYLARKAGKAGKP
jgi:hypothetical protein